MPFSSAHHIKGTPKECAVERLKRYRRIMTAIKMMRESAEKAYISERGYIKPLHKQDDDNSWQEKIASMRSGLKAGKSRMRSKGKAVFQGR